MSRLAYYWQRRNVVRRAIKNWASLVSREPFRRKGLPGDPAVVFVCLNARARQFNHGELLRGQDGIRTILLTRVFDYRFLSQTYDEIHLFYSYRDLAKKIRRLSRRYRLLAVVGSTQPSRQTRTLLDMPRAWPVLFDPYDSLWSLCHFARLKPEDLKGVSTGHSETEAAEEEHCFRNADGVLIRLGHFAESLRARGIEQPMLLLEDGCNPRYYQPLAARSGPKGKEWSVVYAGIFYPRSSHAATQGDAYLVPLGRQFAEERIHFHLYPSPHHHYIYEEYEAEAARNPYFHLHRPVPFGEVHREIARYDFGWYGSDFSRNLAFSWDLSRHSISLKYFTYLEAGLPVITSRSSAKAEAIVNETGAGILVGPDAPAGLRAVLDGGDLGGLLAGVERARRAWDITRLRPSLLAFLREAGESYAKRLGTPALERTPAPGVTAAAAAP